MWIVVSWLHKVRDFAMKYLTVKRSITGVLFQLVHTWSALKVSYIS